MSEAEKIEQLKAKYVRYYAEVPVQKYAAMAIGRDEDTIILWKKKDTKFSDAIKVAHAEWVRKKMAKVKGEFALERLEKAIFKETREIDVILPTPILGGLAKDVPADDSNEENIEA